MSNVEEFPGVTRHPLPVARVLAIAAGAKLTSVVVTGFDQNGQLYFGSSESSGPEVGWILDQAKLALLESGRE